MNKEELEERVKELEDKLSEYEIIEDDIANLYFYKNKISKLKEVLVEIRKITSPYVGTPTIDKLEQVYKLTEELEES